jgi:hypothetical protein
VLQALLLGHSSRLHAWLPHHHGLLRKAWIHRGELSDRYTSLRLGTVQRPLDKWVGSAHIQSNVYVNHPARAMRSRVGYEYNSTLKRMPTQADVYNLNPDFESSPRRRLSLFCTAEISRNHLKRGLYEAHRLQRHSIHVQVKSSSARLERM